MAIDVVMPQMGESIAEGTIVRWIKKVGDSIDKDEPMFEISTDKVDAEIPSPGAGVIIEISVKEGETVPVNSVVARIGAAGEKPSSGAQSAAGAAGASGAGSAGAKAAEPIVAAPAPPAPAHQTLEDVRRQRSSPVVRKIAKEHGVDFTQLPGTGIAGRVTKKDILSAIERGTVAAPAPAAPAYSAPAAPAAPAVTRAPAFDGPQRVEKMGVMRKKIADHMVMSIKTSPHVYSAYEVDFNRLDEIRKKKKAEYESLGAKLTFTALIAKATVDTIREFPFANASIDGENIIYKRDINLGIAVALEQGLIVPVIKNADEKNLLGISRAVQDLAARARSKKLNPDDVQGGTFTITNPGIFGALFGLPIISQPQVAILGVGSIDKRVVVIDDMMAIRPMCYLTLGYDHRLIDGADAGRFLQRLKERLQDFDENA
ncbi:MAG: 2-oxo acid dehydrogenase subunit E2 [Acidobacteria bacterium]|nr:MAG: 2-oxo acid dehydrogenase subunit E2 [Acidobacteriota bacterium]